MSYLTVEELIEKLLKLDPKRKIGFCAQHVDETKTENELHTMHGTIGDIIEGEDDEPHKIHCVADEFVNY